MWLVNANDRSLLVHVKNLTKKSVTLLVIISLKKLNLNLSLNLFSIILKMPTSNDTYKLIQYCLKQPSSISQL